MTEIVAFLKYLQFFSKSVKGGKFAVEFLENDIVTIKTKSL